MLFSIVCDYAGGTYIAQVQALNADEALQKWALSSDTFGAVTRALTDAVIGTKTSVVAVSGLKNVWCWTAEVEGKLALLNVIQTA